MKKILQAMDGVKAKTEVDSSDMKKFLTIVEGRGPLNRLTAAESLTVQTYTDLESSKNITTPVLNVPIGNKPSLIGKYFKQVEQELAESATRKQERADQLAEAVKQRLDPKCWKGKHKEGTKIKGGVRVNNCVPNEAVNPAQQAAIAIAKKKKAGVKENTSIGTMPTTEYVKGIYAAAAENGMGAPEINAVKKQMVLAPNGEVDIMATMQKALQVFQSPAWKKMITDLEALVKRAEAQPALKENIAANAPKTKLNTNKSGQAAQPAPVGKPRCLKWTYSGQWPNQVVTCVTWDRPVSEEEASEASLGSVLQWPEVVNKVNSAMKATGWKGKRMSDDAFMFTTRGAEVEDQWYIAIIDNAGDGFFTYALGTVEEGDPHIDDAFKGKLPNTEASVSELLNTIRDGFGLAEGVPRLSKHISQSKLPPDSLNRRAKNQAIKRLK